ncbi:MAG: two-component regulator propeller domain-containing protein [Reichenbachiella sp.]|uniref:hybrid sensor histidine kinase/response regulator transcription factor n=3 Tax=Reichenbachiella sp. TaxID=2184521 RepID=UPI003263FA03
MIKGLYVFACVFLLYRGLIAQPSSLPNRNIRFEQLPQELGLSQRSINCMIQDRQGYLWMGTWSGLLRYDGYETVLFNANNNDENALKSNKITSLFEASDSSIWVGTMVGGLFRLDPNSMAFKQYIHSDDTLSISDNNIWDIAEDASGSLWIATQNGLNKFNVQTEQFQHWFNDPDNPNSLSYNFITDLHLKDHNLWIATEQGVNKVSVSSTELLFDNFYYASESGDEDLENYVYDIKTIDYEGKELTFWATKKGLKVYDGKSLRSYEVNDKSSSFSFFRCLQIIDTDQPFVVVGSEIGLSLFDISRMEFTSFFGDFNEDVNLSQNTIMSLFIDNGGVLWAGSKKGINKFDTYNNNFSLYETKSFDPTNSILTGIIRDKSGTPWISSLGGGLFKMTTDSRKKTRIEKYFIVDDQNADLTNFIQKLEVDPKGQFWVGTAGAGVYVFDPLKATNSTIRNYKRFGANGEGSISDNYVMSMENALDGGMWIGTWSQGLNKIQASGEVINYSEPWLEQSPLVTMFQQNEEILWIGTRGQGLLKVRLNGADILSHEIYRFDRDSLSLSNDFVNTIFMDSKGQVWIGTEDGLNLYDKLTDSFKRYKQKQGLSNAEVASILEDERGWLWITHFDGITVIDPAKTGDVLVNNFDTKDRVQGGFFYNEVAMKTENQLFFGGSNGFNVIDAKDIFENPNLPKVVIQNLSVFNERIVSGAMLNGRVLLDKPIQQTKQIELEHDENSISFEFAALHFAIPAKNRFAYMLEGFNNQWQYTDASRRFATYTNLKEGTYVFKVKASNDDAVWNEVPREINVVVQPPWWRTNEAFAGYVLIAALLLVLFRKLILIRIQYENDIKLERIKRENTEHLNRAKLQFFTNISHEFRTPLTLILGPIEKLVNSGDGGNVIQQQLRVVANNASRLQRLINQLLDFRKADAGNLDLRIAEGNFYKFLKEIKLSFDALAADKNIKFTLNASSNVIDLYFDRDQMEKVVFNLLSNAFKHVSPEGEVAVQLLEHETFVQLVVLDNGVGIPAAEIDKVFERFFTGENKSATDSGIGLALCKSLVELHHGTIRVESQEQVATRFIVDIPKGKDHFDDNQIIEDFKDSEDVSKYVEYAFDRTNVEQETNRQYRKDISELSRILVVEDNDQVRSFIKSIFQYDYVVLEAENGDEGFAVALEENPDLILSDVMMPIVDGFTLCSRLKQDLNTSHIPIILLTARTSYIYQVEGLEKGADDYITKPFSPEILKLKVKNLLQSREQSRQLAQSNSSLTIEPKKITVTSADEIFMNQAIELVENNISNSEYTVVEFGKDIGLSRMQLYRKLKAIAGLSPNEFVRMMRVKRSAQLLEQGDYNVSEVTYQVGFTDPTYLRKCFKQQFGMTPSEYAKSHKKSV